MGSVSNFFGQWPEIGHTKVPQFSKNTKIMSAPRLLTKTHEHGITKRGFCGRRPDCRALCDFDRSCRIRGRNRIPFRKGKQRNGSGPPPPFVERCGCRAPVQPETSLKNLLSAPESRMARPARQGVPAHHLTIPCRGCGQRLFDSRVAIAPHSRRGFKPEFQFFSRSASVTGLADKAAAIFSIPPGCKKNFYRRVGSC